jgi:hypothetical protein
MWRPLLQIKPTGKYLLSGLGLLILLGLIFTPRPPLPRHPFAQAGMLSRTSSLRVTDPRFDQYVVGIKAGKELLTERVPTALLTSLRGVKNIFLFGNGNDTLGEFQMVDVTTNLYPQTKAALKNANRWDQVQAPRKSKTKRSTIPGASVYNGWLFIKALWNTHVLFFL